MSNFNRIYDLTFEKLKTYNSLVDHIRHENYSQVLFKKNELGVIAELHFENDSIEKVYECQFDKSEMLQTIFLRQNGIKKLIFDREYELSIETAMYTYEKLISSEVKNVI